MSGFFRKIKTVFFALLLSAAVFSGCSSYRDIRIGTCKVESISPVGLKAVDAGLSIDVYNPAREITVSGISGTVYYEGAEIGFFEAPEVVVPGKTSSKVSFDVRATLSSSLNLIQIMSMASGFKAERLTLDISMTVGVKGGLKKKFDFEKLPVSDFFGKIEHNESI